MLVNTHRKTFGNVAMTSSTRRFETHITVATAGANAVDVLHVATNLAKQRIKLAMTSGAVWLTRGETTRRLRRAKRLLKPGDELHLYYDKDILAERPAQPTLIADVGGYSVWNKPFGLRSQGSKWGDHCTVVRWAERHLQPERPAFTVHRLDRAANGLMLVAHTRAVAAALSKLFRDREVEKHYAAVVAGDFSIQANPLRVEEPVDGKAAVSEFVVREVQGNGETTLLDVRIETGRKHQIRKHLADLGFPIVGDRLYGGAESDAPNLQLTACELAFTCPVGHERVEYRLPD